MTNVEQVEIFRKRELELRNSIHRSNGITAGDNLQYSLSDTHYQMRLAHAQQQDDQIQEKEDSAPLNIKLTSEVKIKR